MKLKIKKSKGGYFTMKKRQVVALGLVAAMSMGLLAGCGSDSKKENSGKEKMCIRDSPQNENF